MAKTVHRLRGRISAPVVLATVGGAGMALCWLPLGIGPAMPLGIACVLVGFESVRDRGHALRFGLAFGIARYAVASHFLLALMAFTPAAIGLYFLAIAYIVPFACLETLGAWGLHRRLGVPRPVALATTFVALEWARTLGEASFPADRLVHALGGHGEWTWPLGWIGPVGVTVWMFAAAILIARAWRDRGGSRPVASRLATGVAVWAIVPFLSPFMTEDVADGPRLRVAVVQPSFDVRDKLDPSRHDGMWARLEALTADAAEGADLVVWPESARPVPVVWDEGRRFRDARVEAIARRAGVPILYGTEIVRRSEGRVRALYNGAAVAYSDGEPGDWYAKRRVLPFVEGVPYARAMGWDPFESTGDASRSSPLTVFGKFSPGDGPKVFEVAGARIGVLICFEGMYADLTRADRAADADVLAVLTNDAWWGRSVFAEWHARMASVRAAETGVPIIRAANSGVSGLVTAHGLEGASTALFESTSLALPAVRVAGTARTPYARTGDWALALVFAVPIAFGVRRFVGRRTVSAEITIGRSTRPQAGDIRKPRGSRRSSARRR